MFKQKINKYKCLNSTCELRYQTERDIIDSIHLAHLRVESVDHVSFAVRSHSAVIQGDN